MGDTSTDFLKGIAENEPDPQPVPPKSDQPNPPKEGDRTPKGKTKEIQFKELSDAKDKLQKDFDNLKTQLEDLSKLKPLLPVKDYIEKKHGKVDEESVNQFIEKGKTRKQSLNELSEKYNQKDAQLQDIDITQSDIWKNNYQIPLHKSHTNLTALLAEVDKEGKVKYPELITGLMGKLLHVDEKGNTLSALQIKGIMKEFSNEYQSKTSEEYIVPRLNDIVDHVNDVHSKYTKSIKARQDWQNAKVEREKEIAFEQSEKQKLDIKRELDGRTSLFKKAKLDYDKSKVEGIFTDDKFEELFNSPHNKVIAVAEGKDKPFSYDVLITKLAQGEMFDELVTKYRELEKELEKEKKKNNSGLGNKGTDRLPRGGGEPSNVDNSTPTSFLR